MLEQVILKKMIDITRNKKILLLGLVLTTLVSIGHNNMSHIGTKFSTITFTDLVLIQKGVSLSNGKRELYKSTVKVMPNAVNVNLFSICRNIYYSKNKIINHATNQVIHISDLKNSQNLIVSSSPSQGIYFVRR